MKTLPFTIEGMGDPITVRYARDDEHLKGLAFFDERTGEIVVQQGEEGPGLWILLLHEFLHVGESLLKQAGAIKRRVDHDFVENIPTGLLFLMHQAGMLKDFPIDELLEFVQTGPDG